MEIPGYFAMLFKTFVTIDMSFKPSKKCIRKYHKLMYLDFPKPTFLCSFMNCNYQNKSFELAH